MKKIQDIVGTLNFLKLKFIQINNFYNILRQQNSFKWTFKHLMKLEFFRKKISDIFKPSQLLYAKCDAIQPLK